MALPADFNKIFGSTATGGLTPIGDVNYAKGWEFVGSNPPTKNDFSYLQNLSDLKSQWLYSNKLQRTDPFGDIKSDGTVSQALANLGLGNLPDFGDAASKDVGTTAGTVAAGDDSRFGKMLGVGQTWQDVKASRASGVTYTNTTTRPIMVSITEGSDGSRELTVDGLLVAYSGGVSSDSTMQAIVPIGSTYRFTGEFITWLELR